MRISNRDKILSEGLRMVHERGFTNASVRDIASAARVPLGSFTNHFVSKEAFGLEILEIYFSNIKVVLERTLEDETRSPLKRIEAYLEETAGTLKDGDLRHGCLLGNFSAEMASQCEAIRMRLKDMLMEIRLTLVRALEAAVQVGELPADYDCEDVGGFIFGSMQGAMLVAKAIHSDVPVQRTKKVLLEKVLR